MGISLSDRRVLRDLGVRYMEAASLPVMEEKISLWKALNRGRMIRPMITIDQLPWHELNADGGLTCRVEDRYWRGVENHMRKTLYKWERFPVDMVIDPFIPIPKAVENSGYGIRFSEEVLPTDPKSSVVSHHYINQIRTEADIEKIKDMVITHDPGADALHEAQGQEIFDGIAPVRLIGIGFHLGVWDTLSGLMGVDQIYYDLVDRPEFLLAAMERITSSVIAGIEQANRLEVHDDLANLCHCSHIYTDELLPGGGLGRGPVSRNCWAFGLAQLFTSVSPAVTEEFEIPFITRMAKHFGMIYYGCCDRLDDRLELVKRIPNVRKVSCSPWSDREAFAEKIGPGLVMSNKPNPAYLATDSMDEQVIRDDLARTVNAAARYGVHLELLLKDVSTVRYQPERLTRWADIAMSVAGG